MKRLFFTGIIAVSMALAACQVNNVRDTGGGSVSPTSSVTGVTLDSGMSNNP
ncbi:lysis protein [Enterobacter sp. 63]